MLNLILLLFLLTRKTESALKPVRSPIQVGKLKLSPIGIGTWAWGNQLLWGYREDNDANLELAYEFLLKKGVNWFDTADSYGTGSLQGRSESLLGEFSARNPRPVSFCTKIAPFPWIIGKSAVTRRIEKSCGRLRRSIDLLQLHWPPTLGWQETSYFDAFSEALLSKKAVQIGLSNCGPKTLPRFVGELRGRGADVHSNQVQFSLLSQNPLRSGLTDVCSELGVQPIAYSPLALGLLTDKYSLDRLPKGPRSFLFKEYLPSAQPLLRELRDVARFRGKTVSQVALNWVRQKGFLLIVGVRDIDQARDNLGSLGWDLTTSEVAVLDTAARKAKGLIQNFNQSS